MVFSPDNLLTLKPLSGFEHVTRYWDKTHGCSAAKLKPGDYYVTGADEIITTVLGSCISVCVRDAVMGIGGMNHFMLPISERGEWTGVDDLSSSVTRYGNFAMEHMINAMLNSGANKKRLETKVFGGGQVTVALTGVGASNIEFVHHYLGAERLPIVSEDVGGHCPRKIIFFPKTGRVLMKRLASWHNNTLIEREKAYREEIISQPFTGEVELF